MVPSYSNVAPLQVELFEDRITPANLPAGFVEQILTDSLELPSAIEVAPDGRIFVAEVGGDLRVIKDDQLLPEPFVSIRVDDFSERGLLGVTLDPNFADNQYVYVYYTPLQEPGAPFARVSRFTADGDRAVLNSEVPLVELGQAVSFITNHNGGALHFGPDGKLYIAVGDGGIPSLSQDLSSIHGKILRINSDGTIPPDNPFYNQTSGIHRSIWALGLRNPFTFTFHPITGQMLINDVGGTQYEEVNVGVLGGNYGWPNTEGPTTDPRFLSPILAIPHTPLGSEGLAITGADFYQPTTAQFGDSFVGDYFFADFVQGTLNRYDPVSGEVSLFADGLVFPADLEVTDSGSLLYLEFGGRLSKISTATTLAPQIVSQPKSDLVSVGQDATFEVEVSGASPLSYSWQRDGTAIPGATGPAYTLEKVDLPEDGTRIQVMITNDFGTMVSNQAVLSVTTDLPPDAVIELPS